MKCMKNMICLNYYFRMNLNKKYQGHYIDDWCAILSIVKKNFFSKVFDKSQSTPQLCIKNITYIFLII